MSQSVLDLDFQYSSSRASRRSSSNSNLASSRHPNYSTIAAAAQCRTHSLPDFLISSLGFSEEEAVSSFEKATRGNLSRKPDLVVNFLQNLGLSKTQIKSLVLVDPKLLYYDVDKTLIPKFRVLQDVGISNSDFAKILMHFKTFFSQGRQFAQCVDYLRTLLGSDEKVAKALKKNSNLLHCRAPQTIASNLELLQKNGFSSERIYHLLVHNSEVILRNTDYVQSVMDRVKNDLGISCQSKMSFGLSDATIYKMVARFPNIVMTSEDKIRKAWKFFANELGCAPEYMAARPVMLKLQLERRVKSRIEVVKVLTEKKLNKKKTDIYTALMIPESKFLEKFLLPYKDAIPDLYDSYSRIVGTQKVENL
ncbi:hypothetical protein M9H77_31965 [Catharanthus roseus]|uniref:Uncharacterized protein n=1 Tax=Catharanthus roseus TaxID=4058 RepID=A0ACC0A1N1_CATRO|nr:hypothetical protein M9H77_31965 [Catharanthus roseus]